MNFYIALFASLVSGIVLSFIQSPYNYWFLIFPCFSVFYLCFSCCKNKKQVFVIGFLFSIGYFVSGLNWIGNALLVEGNEFRWVWPIAVIALPTLLSLFTALYLTVSFIFFKNKTVFAFCGFCAALFISEWVRGHAFTGFPWNLYGYGWIDILEIAQITYWLGSYGLTFLTIMWGSIIGLFIQNRKTYPVFIAVILSIGLVYFIGDRRLEKNPVGFNEAIAFHVVQPNIAQAEKWKPENLVKNFEKTIGLSAIQNPAIKNIIVWPETAIPPSFLDSKAVHERINNLLDENTILLTGVLGAQVMDNKRRIQYFNGLVIWEENTPPQHVYSKSHLVPFGEYIPFQKYIPLRPVVAFSGFEKGNGAETIKIEGFPNFTPKICYEIIFPEEIINSEQERPDYILTITNDAWYGDSPGPYQHFTQARFRAIENNLPVVRAANTGISGIIDGYGRVIERSDLMQEAVINTRLPH